MLIKLNRFILKMSMKILISWLILFFAVIYFCETNIHVNEDLTFYSDLINEPLNILKDFIFLYSKFKLIIILLFFIDVYCIYIKKTFKDNITILFLNTFNNVNSTISTTYINTNIVQKDLSDEMNLLGNEYEKYSKIIDKIDKIANNFMEYNKEGPHAFAGIMHTPFIVRLGYKIGDETYFKLFHKQRKDDKFVLLKDKDEYIGNFPKLNITKKIVEGNNELIVSIATTFDIKEEELIKFDVHNKNYIKFETSEKGYEVIISEKQINEYKKKIFDQIRKICKEKNIKKIHLFISSSVAFTFSLAQWFSKNYDPQIIVYNYEGREYAWGVDLFADSSKSIVNIKDMVTVMENNKEKTLY